MEGKAGKEALEDEWVPTWLAAVETIDIDEAVNDQRRERGEPAHPIPNPNRQALSIGKSC